MNPQQPQAQPPQAPEQFPQNQPVEPAPQTQAYGPAPYPGQTPMAQNPGQVPTLPIKKKKNPLVIAAIIAAVLLVIFGVLIGAMLLSQSMHPVTKKEAAVTTPKKSTALLQTFVKADDGSINVTQDGKKLLSLALPTGKTAFTPIATSDHALLVLAQSNDADPAPTGYLLKSDGSQTVLTASIAQAISQAKSYGTAHGMLDNENNFLSIICKESSCQLASLNLTSGETTPIMTQGFTSSNGASTSLVLLGISQKNSAYLMTYSQNNVLDKLGTLISIDLTSGSTTKSLIMSKPSVALPSLSPDFNWGLYTQSQDGVTGQLIDWENGSVKNVSGSIDNGPRYLWSPDSKRALFFNSPANQTSTIGTIANAQASQIVATTFPTSPTLRVKLLGWLDNSRIVYQKITASSPGKFDGQPETHTYDVDTGSDKLLPSTDDILLPISGASLSSS